MHLLFPQLGTFHALERLADLRARSAENVSEAYVGLVASLGICCQSPALMISRSGPKMSVSMGEIASNGPSINSGHSVQRSGSLMSFSVMSRDSSSAGTDHPAPE